MIQSQVSVIFNAVSHRYGGREVFTGVNASVQSGQTAVVSGSNGSGKSTLLKIAAGLLSAKSGDVDIHIDGRLCNQMERRRDIGYLSPDLSLYGELTAAENLQFFANMQGIHLTKIDLTHTLTKVGLQGRGRDLVRAYSSGMRQRLKYAYALLGNPRILLLDEPTANLDTAGVELVENIVAEHTRRADGCLTILATNEPREMNWGDQHIVLKAAE